MSVTDINALCSFVDSIIVNDNNINFQDQSLLNVQKPTFKKVVKKNILNENFGL